jgi:ABC-type multidrug transport system ATPase subunit
VKIRNLSKQYNGEIIFENLNCNFEYNNVYSILGKNGIGKTTMLKILANQIPFDSGNIESSTDDIMFVSDNVFVFNYMSGYEFITYTLKMKNKKISLIEIESKFKEFGLEPNDMYKMLMDYSKGMKYKLIIILILLISPKILLLDEPFVDIDIATMEQVKKVFEQFKNDKIIILTTHIADIAYALSDKVLFLSKGYLSEVDGDIKSYALNNMIERNSL